jgi:predicted flap endonuclease-1-like 5' DNA nuclease
MIALAQAYIIPLIIAFLIGVATGWWMWAHQSWKRRGDASGAYASVSDDYGTSADIAKQWMPVVEQAQDIVAPAAAVLTAAPSLKVQSTPKPPAPKKAAVEPVPIKPRRKREPKAEVVLNAIGIPVAVGAPNDLLQIKGVGPKLNALLNRLGVTRFDQIAAWKAKEISAVDSHLGAFQGRITREDWIDQANLLANGQIVSFEARYGKLDSENK